MNEFVRICFYSGLVCCGLAVLKSVSLQFMLDYFIAGVVCGAVFKLLCVDRGYVFIGSFFATLATCVLVKLTQKKCKTHDYMFIVFPTIYCITPGGAMYKIFLQLFKGNFAMALKETTYSAVVIFGCYVAIIFFEALLRYFEKRKETEETEEAV